jgi:ElaB/YqjD/DUF883 family membrane-anchored ribosome-binding protein
MSDTGTMQVESPQTTGEHRASTKARLRKQTAALGRDVRELGKLTKEASQETISQAKHTASDYLDKSQKKAHEVEESVVHYVREKPLRSLFMAAGAGALLGFLLRR